MKSLQFDYSVPRYVITKALGRYKPSLYWDSRLSCLRLRDVPEPVLPTQDWVKIDVKYGGICGSDLNLISLNDSPATSPYASFPFTIGHEIVGKVADIGRNISGIEIGSRVAIDPVLSCQARGFTNPCPACQRGDFSLCNQKTDGDISPGLLIGACRDTGGSWGPSLVAHKSQIIPLPDEVDDSNGVLAEPFSCALHAVLRNPPKDDDTVLVIGAGVIGIGVIAAIRALGIQARILSLVKHPFQAKLAQHYGADQTIFLTRSKDYIHETAEHLKARVFKPIYGYPVVEGGASLVFECVGRKQSMNDALRLTQSGGKVVLLGLASIMDGIDWTSVWLNELEVKGSFAYSTGHYQGRTMRTLDIAVELMRSGHVDLSPLITHRFPIEQYKEALQTATKKSNQAIKVVFEH
ncbi:zinc-dependent alcohol dehydrogenase [Desertibacillus haloalkaliphilus]|uniref:zinc-dependent alcohol dehydrogenase n=1 Tax=Desertibacillus haloalkaliphilus TaxID=1328930 RepID=UPI001C2718A2|nr:alcohol dehydrogenase catalytic domain-containing protein [Desertibacillus haloalkaliphilus]MBU8906932.1 alcohol dehydrogenase catalytic domain-containing protein [Desertibacillus haloalkaliphilus]